MYIFQRVNIDNEYSSDGDSDNHRLFPTDPESRLYRETVRSVLCLKKENVIVAQVWK